jgi:hypothetical protein
MSTFDEQLATATIAKIFGSELKRVDENTTSLPAGGPANKIDPLSFIRGSHSAKPVVGTPSSPEVAAAVALSLREAQAIEMPHSNIFSSGQVPAQVNNTPQQIPNYVPVQQVLPPIPPDPQMSLPFEEYSEKITRIDTGLDKVLNSIDLSLREIVKLLEEKWPTT